MISKSKCRPQFRLNKGSNFGVKFQSGVKIRVEVNFEIKFRVKSRGKILVELPYAKGDVVVVFVTDALHFGVGGIYEKDRLARHEDLVRVMLVENLGC